MPFPTGTSDTFVVNDELDNPPPVLSVKRFNKEIHDRVYTYALAHWSNLIQDPPSEAYRKNCTTYEEFYRGAIAPIKIHDEFELEQVNLIELFMQVKHGQLLNDRLKIHYIARKNSDWQFANAMSQLFDWHGTQIRRDRLQHRIELCAPLFGTVPVMYIPKTRWQGGEKIMIPADYEYLDPRTTYYESRWDRDEDIPVFMIRTVSVGRLEDQIYKKLLKKRGLTQFARGNEFSKNKDIEGIVSLDSDEYEFTNDWLARISEQDVEVIRVWVKDYTTENVDVYFPTVVDAATGGLGDMTPEIMASMEYAKREIREIITNGKLPAEGEHHYSQLMQHLQDRDEYGGQLDDIQLAYLDTHIEATKEMFKTQPPDRVDKDIPKFKNNWRYIKIIGDQVVADGSSELDFPIAFFHNRINPGSFISISDLDNLINMQDAFNRIYSDEIMNSYQNTYSTRLLPMSQKDSENRKDGPFAEWYFDDLNELAACRNLEAPAGNASNRELMMILVQFMEMVSGGSESARGEYPQKRTAASGIMALQQQSAKRFNATQLSLNDGWTQSARIWLNQIKKYWQGEQFIPAIAPDYREGITLLMDSVDPTAHLSIERIPQDLDYKEQQGNAALQIGMFAMQGGVGFEDVETMLATQYDGSTVSRVMKQLQQIRMANPQGRQRMQMMEDAQMQQAMQGGGSNKQ
jgi:hypothetical protein